VPIEQAKRANIPVLAFDGPTDPSVAGDVMSVLSNNEELGEYAAENLIDGLKAQGRASGKIIVLTGTASMLVTQDRMVGFDKVMSTAPRYQVISEQDANWDPTLSGTIAQQLIAKYGCGGIQGAYGMADYGVRVERALIGLFTVSGALAALGGALLSYSYASANPDPGLQPLILSAVAALLGGVSLAGGRGLPLGLLAGTLTVALTAQIVAMTALPDYTTELLYAALLAVIVAIDAPGLHRMLDRLKARAAAG